MTKTKLAETISSMLTDVIEIQDLLHASATEEQEDNIDYIDAMATLSKLESGLEQLFDRVQDDN